MKYIYFGTPSFSARCLTILLEHGIPPIAVVCNPDQPTGRKKIMTPPPVKTRIEKWNATHEAIKILQPKKLDSDFQNTIKDLAPDFFVVFAYNKIFRADVLAIPPRGTIGIHPSFLPKYRGPSPFQTALLDGARETGVTLYLLDEGVDAGPIIAQSDPLRITSSDTFSSLAEKLADVGGTLFRATLPAWESGTIVPATQDETQATFTKKFITQDGFVDPAELAAAQDSGRNSEDIEKAHMLDRKIRALNPEPGVWTLQNERRMKLLEAKIENEALRLTKIQYEGERPRAV